MGELLLAGGVFVGLGGATALLAWLPWQTQLTIGLVLTIVGAATSLPASALYHLHLYRILRRRGAPPRRWWWRPTALHGSLLGPERRAVLPWLYAGAASFALVVLGGVLALVAAWRMR